MEKELRRIRHIQKKIGYTSRSNFNFFRIGLAIVLQNLAELLTGEEDTALNSAERHVELFRDLLIFIPGNMHGEGLAIIGGEFRYDSRNLTNSVRTIGRT